MGYSLPDGMRDVMGTLYDGLGWNLLTGPVFGVVGGVCLPFFLGWVFVETAPSISGIILDLTSYDQMAAAVKLCF
ncbi:hypothetical protein K469DRAFT_83918 [Zopfia rhizophila CBS 207.26]|uniref:Uncharacterized protein n=1 Tax=Zopfia rhizophila CBS 207.26 TaxID=1314779 RepID=A0A6A6EEP3_9PEZI|nr:hypothetical protein K469DRAFT_83918 [Zopfia rhizophila CBS 207.26]